MLSFPITREFLKPIPGRNTQVLKRLCGVKHIQFSLSNALNVRPKPTRFLPQEDLLGLFVPEGSDHMNMITGSDNNVKRYQVVSVKGLEGCGSDRRVLEPGRVTAWGATVGEPSPPCARAASRRARAL